MPLNALVRFYKDLHTFIRPQIPLNALTRFDTTLHTFIRPLHASTHSLTLTYSYHKGSLQHITHVTKDINQTRYTYKSNTHTYTLHILCEITFLLFFHVTLISSLLKYFFKAFCIVVICTRNKFYFGKFMPVIYFVRIFIRNSV